MRGREYTFCVGANLWFSNVCVQTLSGGKVVTHRKFLKMLYAFRCLLRIRNISLDFIKINTLRVCTCIKVLQLSKSDSFGQLNK